MYGPAMDVLAVDEPVIVLTAARCGSTVLRLLLDAHPDLACPPETNVVKACAQLAAIFDLLGDGTSAESARAVCSAMFGDYLTRRGKRRWCDKSLGTANVADWFADLYPKAKFICLYRHCFDVIHSGLEASPWGLVSYGFEQFAGRPGSNNAAALAAYWADHTSRILEFERANRDRCLRVHYECLATQPDRTAAEIFAFLGVDQVPGITERCFAVAREEHGSPASVGPGDHKIRATAKITADSIGRGIRIPVELIPALQLKAINLLLDELGYVQVDDAWRHSPWPLAPLAQDADPDQTDLPRMLGDEVMRSVLANIGDHISDRITTSFRLGLPSLWPPGRTDDRFGLVAYHTNGQRCARGWQVSVSERSINEIGMEDGTSVETDWLVTGDVETWLGVLSGRTNMASCLRNGALRYIGMRDHQAAPSEGRDAVLAFALETERRLAMARELLGLTAAEILKGAD
jgi:hypothetical protein